MQGKIALEEHFALDGTFYNTDRFSVKGMAEDLGRRLQDIQDIRLAEMDKYGVELAVQSLNSPGVQGIPDVSEAIELAQRSNDVLAEEVAKRPDRFAGFAAVPMQDPDEAVREFRRCVTDLGFKGVMLNGFTVKGDQDTGIFFDGKEYWPFWQTAEELDVPVYLHPRNPLPSQRHAYEGHPWFLNSPWAFAVETSIHALRLLASGLFDEYPRAQLILGHLGERIPFDLWRLDHRLRKSPQGLPAKKSMREYMTQNVHLTTAGNFYDPTLHFTMGEVGVDRIMFSVDYPFEETSDACDWFDGAELSDADRLQIGRTNAVKLLKLNLD